MVPSRGYKGYCRFLFLFPLFCAMNQSQQKVQNECSVSKMWLFKNRFSNWEGAELSNYVQELCNSGKNVQLQSKNQERSMEERDKTKTFFSDDDLYYILDHFLTSRGLFHRLKLWLMFFHLFAPSATSAVTYAGHMLPRRPCVPCAPPRLTYYNHSVNMRGVNGELRAGRGKEE